MNNNTIHEGDKQRHGNQGPHLDFNTKDKRVDDHNAKDGDRHTVDTHQDQSNQHHNLECGERDINGQELDRQQTA